MNKIDRLSDDRCEELRRVFDVIHSHMDSDNWKDVIRASMSVDDVIDFGVETLREAIVFMTGSEANIVTDVATMTVHITADGYYKTIGA